MAIPKSERSAFNKTMLEIKQKTGPIPYSFAKEYPSSGKFTYEGFALHYLCIEQTESPKAIVIHVHGMNSHSIPTGYYASKVTEKNPELNFYTFDQLNFGQSEGPYPGEILSLDDSLKQVEVFIDFVLAKLKSKPKVFLSGSSYGGTVSFKASLKNPERFAGIIFLAPALKDI